MLPFRILYRDLSKCHSVLEGIKVINKIELVNIRGYIVVYPTAIIVEYTIDNGLLTSLVIT